jgi:hypothetical protein
MKAVTLAIVLLIAADGSKKIKAGPDFSGPALCYLTNPVTHPSSTFSTIFPVSLFFRITFFAP